MTLSVIGTGAVVSGTTSVTATLPSGYTAVANDLCIVVVASGHATASTQPTCSGYNNGGSGAHAGSTTTFGADTGPRRLTYFYTTLAAGQGAPVVALSGGNVLAAHTLIVRSDVPGVVLSFASGFAADNSAAASLSATLASNPGFTAGDLTVQAVASTPDNSTITNLTLTATGMTGGTGVQRSSAAVTNGNQLRITSITRNITSGTATAAASMGATASVSSTTGVLGILRIRENPAFNLQATFESGTDGTAITAANSQYDFVQSVSGGSITYSSAAKYRGNLGARFSLGSTAAALYVERQSQGSLNGMSSTGQIYGRYRVRCPVQLPPDSTGVRTTIIADSGGGFQIDPRINNLGQMELRSGAGAILATSSTSYAVGEWIDVGVAILNFGSNNGQLQMRLYNPITGEVLETLTSSANVDTLRAGGENRIQVGIMRALANFTLDFDDMAWSTLGYPELPSPTQPIAQTVEIPWKTRVTISRLFDVRWRVNNYYSTEVQDNFDDNSINTALWAGNTGLVSETGGRARVMSGSGTTNFNYYATGRAYTLDSLMFRMYAAPRGDSMMGNCWTAGWFQSSTPGTDLGFYIDSPMGTIRFMSRVDSFEMMPAQITYDPVAHAFCMLEYLPGTTPLVRWYTSPNAINWTLQRSITAPAWVQNEHLGRVVLETHREFGTANAQYAEFDWVNITPPATTVVSQSTDLRWRSRAQVSQSSDMRWRSVARVQSSVDLRWLTRTTIQQSSDLRWRSLARVAATVDARWRSASLLQSSVALPWRSYIRTSSDTENRWRVFSAVNSSVSIPWRVRVAIAQTLDSRWRSYTRTGQSISISWRSQSQVSSTLDARWRYYAPVYVPIQITWRNYQIVSRVADLRWNSAGGLAAMLDVPWRTYAPVAGLLDVRWKSIASVSSQMDLRWRVRSQVSQSLNVTWRSVARVQSQVELPWRSRSQVSQSTALPWRVYSQVSASSSLTWRSYTTVSQTTDARWRSASRVSASTEVRWNSRISIAPASLSIPWRQLAQVTRDVDLRYKVVSSTMPISNTLDMQWAMARRVSGSVDVRWRTWVTVSTSLDARWSSRVRISPSDVYVIWDSYARVSSQASLPWKTYQSVSSQLIAPWRSSARVSADTALTWRAAGRVAADVTIPWLSRVSILQLVDLRWRARIRMFATLDARWITIRRVGSNLVVIWKNEGLGPTPVDDIFIAEIGRPAVLSDTGYAETSSEILPDFSITLPGTQEFIVDR